MFRLVSFCSAAAILVCAAGVASVQAGHRATALAVVMTNDPMSNQAPSWRRSTRTSTELYAARQRAREARRLVRPQPARPS